MQTKKCFNFEESLRFGEDILWKNNYEKFKNSELCFPCKYIFFPESIPALIKKFYFLNLYSLKYGSNLKKKINIYCLLSLIVYFGSSVLFFVGYKNFSLLTLSIYFFLRFIHKNKFSYLFDINIVFFVFFQIFLDFFRLIIVLIYSLKKIIIKI